MSGKHRLVRWTLSALLVCAGVGTGHAAQSKGNNGQQGDKGDKNDGVRDLIRELDANLRQLIATGDNALGARLDALRVLLEQADAALRSDLAAETAGRTAADIALGARLEALRALLEQADAALRNDLDAETAGRKQGDMDALAAAKQHADQKVAGESAERAAADLALGERIDQGSLASLGCASGQIPLFNGTGWTCADRTPPGPRRPVAALILGSSTFGGWVWSVEGGDIAAGVISESIGSDGVVRKNLGNISYKDIVVQVNPFAVSSSVHDWLSALYRRQFVRKNGRIVFFGEDGQAEVALEFFDALITETGFPALDASTPGAEGFMTLTISPENTRRVAGDHSAADPSWPAREAQTKWLPSNFRLELAGLPPGSVKKVEAFAIRQLFATSSIGDARDYQREPGKLELPNLAILLSQAGSQDWVDWFQSFVIQGDQGAANEKSGALVFLAPNGQDELGRLTLGNVGIFSLAAGQGPAADMPAGLYLETTDFVIPAPVAGGASQP